MMLERSTPPRIFGTSLTVWVFGLSFAVLVGAALATPYFADSPELAAGGILLGLAHAPSFPAYALLVKGLSLLPLGGLAFRVSLVSALCGALSVTLLFRLGARLTGHWQTSAWSSLLFLATPAFWLSATRQEVYTFQLCVSLGVLWFILDWLEARAARGLFLAGLFFGLGMGVHSLLTLALLPPIVVALVWVDARRAFHPRVLALCTLAALLGLSVYGYLPLRSSVDPILDWNDPERLSGFLDSFTKRRETGLFVSEVGWGEKLQVLLRALTADFTPMLVWLGALGLGPLLTQGRPKAFLLLGLGLCNAATMLMAPTYDAENPDAPGYLLLSWGIWALLLGLGLERLLPKRLWLRIGLMVGLLLVGVGFSAPRFPEGNEARGRMLGLMHLESAPLGALALVKSDAVTFQLWFLQWIEGRRPDVLVVNRKGLRSSAYQRVLVQADPGLQSAFEGILGGDHPGGDAPAGGSAFDRTDAFQRDLQRLVQTQGPRRALLWEAGSDNRWLRPFTRPVGPWLRIEPAPVFLTEADHRRSLETVSLLFRLLGAEETRLDPRVSEAYEVVLYNLLNSLGREQALPVDARVKAWETLYRRTGSAASGLALSVTLLEAGRSELACELLSRVRADHPGHGPVLEQWARACESPHP